MGGAETAARQLAEHLTAECGWTVEVFTTCAVDHITWDDVLAPGDSVLNGVTVHRFRSASGRVPEFYDLDGRLRSAPAQATETEARRWLECNGPVTLDLVDALRAGDADVVAFYPYLYYPTVVGLEAVAVPRVLHPAAHDEPALYLPVFAPTYAEADADLLPHGRRTPPRATRPPRGPGPADRPRPRRGCGRRGWAVGGRHPRDRRPALRGERRSRRRAQGVGHAGPVLRALQGEASRAAGPGPRGSGGGIDPRSRGHRASPAW